MSNYNKVLLLGRLTRDPELRYTPQGTSVSDLGLAVNREYTLSSGEKKKETLFVDVTVWKKQAELCCQYLRKGSPLFIEGRLTMDSWEGQDGQKRTKIRVVADNFQFIGGGGGRTGAEVPEVEEGPVAGDPSAGDPAGGNYGSNFRRSSPMPPRYQSSPPGRPDVAQVGEAPVPANDEYGGPKEDDIPF